MVTKLLHIQQIYMYVWYRFIIYFYRYTENEYAILRRRMTQNCKEIEKNLHESCVGIVQFSTLFCTESWRKLGDLAGKNHMQAAFQLRSDDSRSSDRVSAFAYDDIFARCRIEFPERASVLLRFGNRGKYGKWGVIL